MRIYIPKGEHTGGGGHLKFAKQPDSVYYRYHLRFAPNFKLAEAGKIPGLASVMNTGNCFGIRPPTTEDVCWSARGWMGHRERNGVRDTSKVSIGSYIYHLGQRDAFGDSFPWKEGLADLKKGRWYCVEGHIRMNTPGQPNGVVEGWINGKPAFSKRDFLFRTKPDLGIQSFWTDIYVGGGDTSPVSTYVDLDNVATSSKVILFFFFLVVLDDLC